MGSLVHHLEPQVPRAVRAADARRALPALERPGRGRGGAHGEDRRRHVGAGAGRGRHPAGSPRVPAGPACAHPGAGCPARPRRGPVRPGAHGQALRVPACWHHARHPHPGQAAGRRAAHGRHALARGPGGQRSRWGTTAAPSAATRWRRPPRWRCSTDSLPLASWTAWPGGAQLSGVVSRSSRARTRTRSPRCAASGSCSASSSRGRPAPVVKALRERGYPGHEGGRHGAAAAAAPRGQARRDQGVPGRPRGRARAAGHRRAPHGNAVSRRGSEEMSSVKKVVLAYSGGLDTSIIIPWIKENYPGAEIIAYCGDVGQGDDLEAVKKKALATGAQRVRGRRPPRGVRPRLRLQGPLRGRRLRGQLPARHLPGPPAAGLRPGALRAALRRRRAGPRRHRQGQRPGALRGDLRHLRAAPEGHRPLARVGHPLARGRPRLRGRPRRPASTSRPATSSAATATSGTSPTRAATSKTPGTRRSRRCSSSPWTRRRRRTRPQEVTIAFEQGVPVSIDGKTPRPGRARGVPQRDRGRPRRRAVSTWSRTGSSA